MKGLLIYLAAVNLAAFAAMGADKAKARRKKWRIPESTLLLLSLIGGSAGGLLGMLLFRHKTRHAAFFLGIPVMLVLHAGILWFLLRRGA